MCGRALPSGLEGTEPMRNTTNLAIAAAVMLLLTPIGSRGDDPRNESECLTALAEALETECGKVYAGADQTTEREQCLNAIAPQVKRVCVQFFGGDADFCAICNKSCTDNFPPGSGERRECLTMCLNHQEC